MLLDTFLNRLKTSPESVSFENTMTVIDEYFNFTETAFVNGDQRNAAGQNNGSCKIFSFGKLNALTEQQTLHCFGDFYRIDVLNNPEGNDHQNIRNFIQHGWNGIGFDGQALAKKSG